MDLSLAAQDLAFREEIRAFLKTHLPVEISSRVKLGLPVSKILLNPWWQTLNRHGWAAPAWPKEDGGRSLSLTHRHIFDMECRAHHAPPLPAFNINMIGPALIRFGNEQQKARFLPKTLSGEIWWCQGYSESGAGSDLANVSMRAERDGDAYVVNGTKIWTSGAEQAQWIFCLTRSDLDVQPQRGITFLLIDMDDPGVSVTPIIAMNGVRLWNQVILEDVRVPVENRLGEENHGWTVAKALLGDERIFVSRISESTRLLAGVREMAKAERSDGHRLIDDPGFAKRLAELSVRLQALDMMGLRLLAKAEETGDVGAEPSALKALGSPLVQAMDEAYVEAAAYYGMPSNRESWADGSNIETVGPDCASALTSNYLHHRGYTIAGGTTEIQKNILAKAVLGL
jgi:alkylation response protein AidB-like acyl-CoA dehydrogenase